MLTYVKKTMLFNPIFLSVVVLLLIGVPLLSQAIVKVLRDQVNINGPLIFTSSHSGVRSWNAEPFSPAYYIIGTTREDDDGNITGRIRIAFYREHIGEVERKEGIIDSVKYTASSWVEGDKGKANAWVIAPGKGKKHDENPNGASKISRLDPDLPSFMYAKDSCWRGVNGVGQRTLIGSASLFQGGFPPVSVQVSFSEK